MDNIIQNFDSISLAEMSAIRLMNRSDSKFVTTKDKLELLLKMAYSEYRIQEIEGKRNMRYYTVYFDTADHTFYNWHHNGHAGRQKVRLRSYVDTSDSFLEVKTKNNHNRTSKRRVAVSASTDELKDMSLVGNSEFLHNQVTTTSAPLSQKLENRFHRITLVNRMKTERLTIDMDLQFHNLETDRTFAFQNLVIIELKRDGLQPSPILSILRQLHIKPSGFSKYCIGSVLTNSHLRSNRLKKRVRRMLRFEEKPCILNLFSL